MTRTFRLVTLGVFGVWSLTSMGCEDKVCNEALQASKKQATEQGKECANNLAKLSELKAQLTAAQATGDSLTKENAELQAKLDAAAAKAKTKAKGGKAKHKKRSKK